MSVAPHLRLPPPDRLLSSRTGWTRAHWEVTADRMLDALVPYATPGLAQYRLPGRSSWSGVVSDGLEGFARSFLLAACRIAGAGGAVDPALIERYATGLASGTDRDSGEAWPELTDCSQQMVEGRLDRGRAARDPAVDLGPAGRPGPGAGRRLVLRVRGRAHLGQQLAAVPGGVRAVPGLGGRSAQPL
ncbi:hypothetical protein ACVWXU_002064 [Streptomyces sp. TE33382]